MNPQNYHKGQFQPNRGYVNRQYQGGPPANPQNFPAIMPGPSTEQMPEQPIQLLQKNQPAQDYRQNQPNAQQASYQQIAQRAPEPAPAPHHGAIASHEMPPISCQTPGYQKNQPRNLIIYTASEKKKKIQKKLQPLYVLGKPRPVYFKYSSDSSSDEESEPIRQCLLALPSTSKRGQKSMTTSSDRHYRDDLKARSSTRHPSSALPKNRMQRRPLSSTSESSINETTDREENRGILGFSTLLHISVRAFPPKFAIRKPTGGFAQKSVAARALAISQHTRKPPSGHLANIHENSPVLLLSRSKKSSRRIHKFVHRLRAESEPT